jgi:outer membrane lipoprotein-sorting protein
MLCVVIGLAAGLSGCYSTTRLVPKAQAPEMYKTATVEELEKSVSDRDAVIKTMNAAVLITATTGGAKEGKVTEYTSFRGYIFVQQPANLRVILQLPVVGSRALDMVSDGKTFTLVRASLGHGDIWTQGTNTVTNPSKNGLENLRPGVFLDSLLVPGVVPGEFVTLTESTREAQPETKHHDAVLEPDYDLTVLRAKSGDKAGNVLVPERVIHISRVTMLPFQQDIYNDAGQVVTMATYDKYAATGEQQMPMLVTIKRPLEEYSLKIEFTKLTLNETFEPDQFELKVPAGVTVQRLN